LTTLIGILEAFAGDVWGVGPALRSGTLSADASAQSSQYSSFYESR
jgi:hypothetical protein